MQRNNRDSVQTAKSQKTLSSALVDQVDDQVVSVLQARAEPRLSRLGAGADEEQLPVSHVAQVEAVVDLGDAAGSRQVLAEFGQARLVSIKFHSMGLNGIWRVK